MKFAICNEIFKDWAFDRAFSYIGETGYDAVEIAPSTLAKHVTDLPYQKRLEIKDLASRAGIEISGIHWVLVETEGMHMTSPEEATRKRTARYFVDLADFCADLGGKSIIVGSPHQRNLEPGVSWDQAWAWGLDTFREGVARAEERGVTMCFEPLAPSETNFINTAQEAVAFVSELNSPAFQVILDVKAMCSMGRPIPDIIRETKGRIGYFHANDANLKGPGFGEVAFEPIAEALAEVDYQGFVSVEVFKFDEGPEAIATRSLQCLRKAFKPFLNRA